MRPLTSASQMLIMVRITSKTDKKTMYWDSTEVHEGITRLMSLRTRFQKRLSTLPLPLPD
jgi:hypothetical protein